MSKKLTSHPSANCYIRVNADGSIDFISYSTRVITLRVRNGRREAECTGLYSMTTRRQITWFLREYAPSLYLDDMRMIVGRGFVTC